MILLKPAETFKINSVYSNSSVFVGEEGGYGALVFTGRYVIYTLQNSLFSAADNSAAVSKYNLKISIPCIISYSVMPIIP